MAITAVITPHPEQQKFPCLRSRKQFKEKGPLVVMFIAPTIGVIIHSDDENEIGKTHTNYYECDNQDMWEKATLTLTSET